MQDWASKASNPSTFQQTIQLWHSVFSRHYYYYMYQYYQEEQVVVDL